MQSLYIISHNINNSNEILERSLILLDKDQRPVKIMKALKYWFKAKKSDKNDQLHQKLLKKVCTTDENNQLKKEVCPVGVYPTFSKFILPLYSWFFLPFPYLSVFCFLLIFLPCLLFFLKTFSSLMVFLFLLFPIKVHTFSLTIFLK